MKVNLLRTITDTPAPTESAAANAVVRGLWLGLTFFCGWATAHLWPSVGAIVFLSAAIATLCIGLLINLRES